MKIAQLLSKESKWCKNALAKDKNGKAVNCLDVLYLDQGRRTFDLGKNAASFSLYGAVCKCYDYDDHENVLEKLHQAMRKILGKDMVLAEFNNSDKTIFENVKAVIIEAGV